MDIQIDIKLLIEWLGSDGAKAGLRGSNRMTLNELRRIADFSGIKYKSKIKRNDLIDLLILQYDKRIDKNFNELKSMRCADLAEYLDRTGCSREEIIALLNTNDIPFKKADSRVALIHHAADQISGWGMFERIAGNVDKSNN